MANSEWKASEGPIRLICGSCGSDDVYGSASVVWEDISQRWAVEGSIEQMNCRTCDRENVEVMPVEIKRPIDSQVPVFIRAKRNTEGAA
jgi:type VI protein secretion system component Hcp